MPLQVGLYQEAVEAYEVVLGDGSLVTATRDNEYSDLYYCLPWSHGSLGFLVGLTLQIIRVQPYIHMRWTVLPCTQHLSRYIPVRGQGKYCDMIRQLSGAGSKDQQVTRRMPSTGFVWRDFLVTRFQTILRLQYMTRRVL